MRSRRPIHAIIIQLKLTLFLMHCLTKALVFPADARNRTADSVPEPAPTMQRPRHRWLSDHDDTEVYRWYERSAIQKSPRSLRP